MKQEEKKKLYAVDLDGVLCTEVKHWLGEKPLPIIENIKKVNKLFDEGNTIIIYTARLEEDRDITTYWLNSNRVKYTALVLNKLRADVYVDDKSGEL